MRRIYSGSAVPRHHVFILTDGTFAVQWDEWRVQELLTGRYRSFNYNDFGHAITDYELNQLKAAGRVEHYNRNYVWLFALPEQNRFSKQIKTLDRPRDRVRTYYISTSLPKSQFDNVQGLLKTIGQGDELLARVRDGLVVILGKQGAAFERMGDAENAQKLLRDRAPALFDDSAVAFIERSIKDTEFRPSHTSENMEVMNFDLDMLIASQTDTTVTQGKRVVLVMAKEEDRKAIGALLTELQTNVHMASTAAEALDLLEDSYPHLLIMDLQLPDMHGWRMLNKAREIDSLRGMHVIVLGDHEASANEQTFALTVAKVDVYLVKPVSMASLRQNIWMILRGNALNSNHRQ